jgi:ABC-type bacteriocin/lantibiotic exporter with double-glycine peptidase domain
MIFDSVRDPDRRFFVPEVVQTSEMDCGPATLKSLLEGFGISVSYGRLREACQTDVDGTSIDVMEDVAMQLGLEAEQVMVPADHLLLPEAKTLPAIVVVRQPSGLTHFVVVWSYHGPLVQVMDPAMGRRWLTRGSFLRELHLHTFPVPAEAWREWAGSEEFCNPLRQRMAGLRMEEAEIERLVGAALADPDWRSLAALDAAIRMVEAIVRADGLDAGQEAAAVLERFFKQVQVESPDGKDIVPAVYWSVRHLPPDPTDADQGQRLLLRGAVLVRVRGRRPATPPAEGEPVAPLSPELVAALKEAPSRPELEILHFLREDGLLTPAVLTVALALASGGVVIEALLLRGILGIGATLGLVGQRIGAAAVLFTLAIGLLLLELPVVATVTRIGRRLEARLRMAFLEKIPRLGDRYFHSRLTSDMTQRAHDLRQLRTLPNLGVTFLRLSFQIVLTALGVIWLEPASAPLAIVATFFAVGLSFATQPFLAERDLRLRTHVGALSRFYLDALLGLVPLRTHGAERAVRREHESLLVEWARSGMSYYSAHIVIQGIEALVGSGFAVWILLNYVAHGGQPSGILLLFYWTLNLPVLGQAMADVAQQYPLLRNRVLRLLEPLGASDESGIQAGDVAGVSPAAQAEPKTANAAAITISMEDVTVQAGGHVILADINLTIEAGEHVAIVGPSGAGKSSLVGLLLGWYWPVTGRVLVDGLRLSGQRLQAIRRETVWVDPAVQLWNRSLLENLRYGIHGPVSAPIMPIIEQANLFGVVEKLPDGLQTSLGEGGGLVSGGEGQRVRLGRSMLRPGVRLVILDEPFRGLDREQRRELLVRARQHWPGTTLLFISHDISETCSFGRVIVVEAGRIVEDGTPEALVAQSDSRYRALLEAEEAVRKGMWSGVGWRRLWLEDGRLEET